MDGGRWKGRRVVVAVPDATRAVDPLRTLAPLLAALLPHASRVDVIVALGLHRPMTELELAPIRSVCGAVPITQHDPAHPDATPFHPLVTAADSVIVVGIVEPHQYAGFSGGIKTVAIGCANAAAIGESHGLGPLRDPGTRIGSIVANPFQAMLWARASELEDVWALQVVPGSDRIFFGPVRKTFEAAVRLARQNCFETRPRSYEWVHLPVAAAKAQSFYQASRAATYVALVDAPIVECGGVLIVDAACPEGMGQGVGEKNFAATLARGVDVLRAELGSDRTLAGGAQRAYVLVMAQARASIVLVGAPSIVGLKEAKIRQFASLAEASSALRLDPANGTTVDDVFHRVPVL